MYLTKLFVVVILIATLGQIEGRCRWFKRMGKSVGCDGNKKSNFANEEIPVEIEINSQSRNGTEFNFRKPFKFHKLTRGGTISVEGNSSFELTGNSTDCEHNLTNTKLRRSKINRRMEFADRHWNFKNTTNIAGNATNSDIPLPTDNDQGKIWKKSRKYGGRFGLRSKCEKPELQDNQENKKEHANKEKSNEHLPMSEGLPILEEANQNLNQTGENIVV